MLFYTHYYKFLFVRNLWRITVQCVHVSYERMSFNSSLLFDSVHVFYNFVFFWFYFSVFHCHSFIPFHPQVFSQPPFFIICFINTSFKLSKTPINFTQKEYKKIAGSLFPAFLLFHNWTVQCINKKRDLKGKKKKNKQNTEWKKCRGTKKEWIKKKWKKNKYEKEKKNMYKEEKLHYFLLRNIIYRKQFKLHLFLYPFA